MTGMLPTFIRDPKWYCEIEVEGVDPKLPGLYEWRIEGVGCYVGQYTRSTRPRREYGKNVANIAAGRPYRKGRPEGFREIHRALHNAMVAGRRITLVENEIDKVKRNRRERELILQRRREAEHDGLRVLNST